MGANFSLCILKRMMRELEELAEEFAWALAKIRYARAVIQEAQGDPAKGAGVLQALAEIGEEN